MDRKIKVLILAANPRDTSRLSVDEEIREILKSIRGAELRDRFEVTSELALRAQELPRALMSHQPDIVHFSGHGTADGALCLVNDATQQMQLLSTEQLIGIFKPLSSGIRCVVLSACYSAAQAQALVSSVPCVVGMSRAVKDTHAIAFAAGFYEALAFGKSVQNAFELGRVQAGLLTTEDSTDSNLHLRNLKKGKLEEREPAEKEIPQLLVREDTDASTLVLAPRPDPYAALVAAPAPAPPVEHQAQQSITVGEVVITGMNNTSTIGQHDRYGIVASASGSRGSKEIEIKKISMSGIGNVSNVIQSNDYGISEPSEQKTSPLESARRLVEALSAAVATSPLRAIQKQMADPPLSLLKEQLACANPVRVKLAESIDDLRPLFTAVPTLTQQLDRLAVLTKQLDD